MENFFASLSGTLGVLGSLVVFFVVQRKDTRHLVEGLKEMILRESNQQAANTQRVADDLKEVKTYLEDKIEKESNRHMEALRETKTYLEDKIEKESNRYVEALRETKTGLEDKIEKESNRLAEGTRQNGDRLLTIDDRVREMEGDMKVVMHRLQAIDGHPAPPEPDLPRPVPSAAVQDIPERRRSVTAPAER